MRSLYLHRDVYHPNARAPLTKGQGQTAVPIERENEGFVRESQTGKRRGIMQISR